MKTNLKTTIVVSAILAATLTTGVYAQGNTGTAKPPPGPVPTYPLGYSLPSYPPLPPLPAACNLLIPGDCPTGFSVTGFIQNATSTTVQVNGITYTIPANTILQMPAATLTWNEFINPSTIPTTSAIGGVGLNTAPIAYPSVEITLIGNYVKGNPIVGLVYVSQESMNSGQGYITGFDYAHGVMFVGNSPPPANSTTVPTTLPAGSVAVQLNDPIIPAIGTGRFSAGQSPDARFSVDQDNPTIHASTGYPMCIPRQAPTAGAEDARCPQKNRPLVQPGCRNFAADFRGSSPAIALPKGGDIGTSLGQRYCTAFVMPAPPASATATTTGPDSRLQAPFEVGDFVTYAGTLVLPSTGTAAFPYSNGVSAHTIEASVGIFTSHGSLPVYTAIGEFGVGVADTNVLTAITGARQETTNRLVLEAEVSDVTSIVDIYLVDKNPTTGAETNRWITPESMTGDPAGVNASGANNTIGGGIYTQYTGVQAGRVRIRATKAPLGLTVSPTRSVRVVVRSLCGPEAFQTSTQDLPVSSTTPTMIGGMNCVHRMPAANGLFTGQYAAPNFGFIFPENVAFGEAIVPNNFWDMGFLYNGEGPGASALSPLPW